MARDALAILGVLSALIWFFYRWQHGRRAQLELACSFFPSPIAGTTIAEVTITIENKGLVIQDIHGFTLAVHGISAFPDNDAAGQLLIFDTPLLPEHELVESDPGIRPGIRRSFTYPLQLRPSGSLIQIAAALKHAPSKRPINTVKRIFAIDDSAR